MAGKKDELKRVYALTGGELLLIREALAELKRKAGVDGDESFDLTELDGAAVGAAEIAAAVTTAPFLAERRTVVVRRADRLRVEEAESLAAVLPKLPKSALLILAFENPPDPRSRAKKQSPLIPVARECGSEIRCGPPNRRDLLQKLRTRAQEENVKFGPGAAELLADLTGDDLTEATGELEKVVIVTPAEGVIDKKVVQHTVMPSREWRVFHLLDAVCAGRTGSALRQMGLLLRMAPRIDSAAMRDLFPMVHRQLRLIWQARACRDAAIRTDSAASDAFCPRHHNWPEAARRSGFVRDKIRGMAPRLSLTQLAAMFRSLAEADMRLKGQLPGAFPRETVERMVVEMCRTAARS
ncbi:MAG: DNA polymerase III subunit delta [Armatimonadetes bacterium]|nr:DNA polymerase III subunit delta [Armatimonadota bacterium]